MLRRAHGIDCVAAGARITNILCAWIEWMFEIVVQQEQNTHAAQPYFAIAGTRLCQSGRLGERTK